MKKYITLIALVLIQLSANAQKPNINQFSFLMGGWQMKTDKGKVIEVWTKSKDSLNGKSYRVDLNGNNTLTETVILKLIDGTLNYCVTGLEKNNLGTTNFKLISSNNKTFVFENKSHDFPQRIVYQNKGKNQLLAWIEGDINGKKMKSEFLYTKRK